MNALKLHWHKLAEKMNGLQIRERALIVCSLLLCIYLIWDFGFFQAVSKERAALELRLSAASKDLVKLTAEEQVFTKSLQSDPGAAKKREIVRLEQELQALDKELQQLAVGLISAEKLPQVLYEVLQKSVSLKFMGMQSHPVELLSFDQQVLAAENKKPVQDSFENDDEQRVVGVFKHAVTVSFEGDYFSVIRYLKSIEALEWKIYWNELEYKVTNFPRAQITLEVFTLSTEEGLMGAKS